MDHVNWLELAANICNFEGIGHQAIDPIATWDQKFCANTIYRINGQFYLKVFGPAAEQQFHVERSVLLTLRDYNSINAPSIVAEEEHSQFPPYLILTEVLGSTAEDAWDDIPRPAQLAIARQLGTITAAIHCLPQQDLARIESNFGGRSQRAKVHQSNLIDQIEATQTLPVKHREHMVRFLNTEAHGHLEQISTLAHCELAHNHIYLSQDAQEANLWKVNGIIDWADAMIGPPEWDITFLWFWTFSRDGEAMREYLKMFYGDSRPPDRFARRCLAAILHTHSGPGLWAEFAARSKGIEAIERDITEYLFPPDVFGPPD